MRVLAVPRSMAMSFEMRPKSEENMRGLEDNRDGKIGRDRRRLGKTNSKDVTPG
jgi:hypothetical protein